jgi:hypothetical protein
MIITPITENGFALSEVFSDDMLQYALNLVDTFTPDRVEYGNREIHLITEAPLINAIRQIVPGARGMELWRDNPGYFNPGHFDDPNAGNVLIVYLGDYETGLGTWFDDNGHHVTPYKMNTGIKLLNSTKIFHGMDGTVPAGFVRKVLYFNWFV